jgi:hypothetical protein
VVSSYSGFVAGKGGPVVFATEGGNPYMVSGGFCAVWGFLCSSSVLIRTADEVLNLVSIRASQRQPVKVHSSEVIII